MKTKLARSIAVALALAVIGFMSISLKSVNAQGKASQPAKSAPAVNSPAAQPAGAGASSLAPAGSGATSMQNVETPPAPEPEKAEGGCCSMFGKK